MSIASRHRRAQVVDLVARHLLEPARQRVVAGEVRDVGQGLDPRDRHHVRRIAVVGKRPSPAVRRDRDECPAIAGRGERDRSRAEDDEPARTDLRHELAQAIAERPSVSRTTDDRHVAGAGGDERAPVVLGQRRTRVRDPARERPGCRIGLRVEDSDGDRRHRSSLAGAAPPAGRPLPDTGRRVRTNGPRIHRPWGERRRCGGDADRSGPGARRAPRHAPARGLAPLRDRAGRRHRPARVPQRRGRARRPRPDRIRSAGRSRSCPRSRCSSASSGVGRASAGGRASSISTCWSSGVAASASNARRRPDRPMPRSTRRRPQSSSWSRTPRPRRRLFVLAPLADLAPRLVPPGWGETVETARRRQERIEGAGRGPRDRRLGRPSTPVATGAQPDRPELSAQVARRQLRLDGRAVRSALDPVRPGVRPRRDDLGQLRAAEDERGAVIGGIAGGDRALGDEPLVDAAAGSPRRRSAGRGSPARTRDRRTGRPGRVRTNRSSRSRTSTAIRPTGRS